MCKITWPSALPLLFEHKSNEQLNLNFLFFIFSSFYESVGCLDKAMRGCTEQEIYIMIDSVSISRGASVLIWLLITSVTGDQKSSGFLGSTLCASCLI